MRGVRDCHHGCHRIGSRSSIAQVGCQQPYFVPDEGADGNEHSRQQEAAAAPHCESTGSTFSRNHGNFLSLAEWGVK